MINDPFCLWGGKPCSDPHNCFDCAVRDRESKMYPEHVIDMKEVKKNDNTNKETT